MVAAQQARLLMKKQNGATQDAEEETRVATQKTERIQGLWHLQQRTDRWKRHRWHRDWHREM